MVLVSVENLFGGVVWLLFCLDIFVGNYTKPSKNITQSLVFFLFGAGGWRFLLDLVLFVD